MPSLARTFYREERSAGVVVGTQSIWGCRGQCPRRSRGAALASPDGRGGSPSGETERACIYLQNTVYFRFFTAFALSVKNRRFLPAPPVGEPSGVRWRNWLRTVGDAGPYNVFSGCGGADRRGRRSLQCFFGGAVERTVGDAGPYNVFSWVRWSGPSGTPVPTMFFRGCGGIYSL